MMLALHAGILEGTRVAKAARARAAKIGALTKT